MKEGHWVIRTHQAGAVGEKTKFWVPGKRPGGKSRKNEKAQIRKQEQNEYSSLKQAARILNANFTKRDVLLGLDYSGKGMEKLEKWIAKKGIILEELDEAERLQIYWDAADHELTNCLRRAKAQAKKLGVELKAFYITSDMDPRTGETVRVHHHLVINREAVPAFEQAWKNLGSVDWETLWSYQEDRFDLAEYLLKQVRRIPDAKKYKTTRNLIRVKPKDRIVLSDAELRVPRHAKLVYRQEFSKPGQPQYIRYVLPNWCEADPPDDEITA